MIQASGAEVFWDSQKKNWVVRIRVGEEAVRRPCKGGKQDAADDTLRSMAVQTANEDGYELSIDAITIKR
jgi:hypothetical protein